MAALQRFQAARTLAAEGRHEEALQEYTWFFEHAHKEIKGFYAVRLSGVLADWVKLAEVYPKARQALEAIRDRKAQLLRLRLGRWDLFHEVVSINDYLGCRQQTYQLFKELAESDRGFAERCFDIALASILEAQDYAFAERFLADPVEKIAHLSDMLNRTVRRYKPADHPDTGYLESQIDFYAKRIREVLSVLEGCGRPGEAARMHELAVESVELSALRAPVRAALEPGARPWYEAEPDAGQ
jgi:hypothetical protein